MRSFHIFEVGDSEEKLLLQLSDESIAQALIYARKSVLGNTVIDR